MKPKKAQVIEYLDKNVFYRALLVQVTSNESLLVVKHRRKTHFIHIIGEKLGSGHELGYYYTPHGVPLPITKEEYRVIKEIEIDNPDILEDALFLARHQPGLKQTERFFGNLLDSRACLGDL